MFLRKKMT